MTDYYVRKTGSDGAAGTSPGAAWATIGKALTTGGIAAGDRVFIGAGTYRESVTANIDFTTMTVVHGDVTGEHTGDPGQVYWSAWTTSDVVVPVGRVLECTASRNMQFENIVFVCGSNNAVEHGEDPDPYNLVFINCAFIGSLQNSSRGVLIAQTTAHACNVYFDRCRFFGAGIRHTWNGVAAGADWDANVVVMGCFLIAGDSSDDGTICTARSATNTYKAGGLKVINNTIITAGQAVYVKTDSSTSIKAKIYNNLIFAMNAGAYALQSYSTSAQDEDYNAISAASPRLNVTAGANSLTGATKNFGLVDIGQAFGFGAQMRSPSELLPGNPALNMGRSSLGGVVQDLFGAPALSSGTNLPNVGAMEKRNSAQREQSVFHSGSNSLKFVGPGYQDFQTVVDAASTTVSMWARYNSGYNPALTAVGTYYGGPVERIGTHRAAAVHPDQRFVAIAHDTSPYISVYTADPDMPGLGRRLVNPATLPAGNGRHASWSPDGDYLAVAHETSPFVTVYAFDKVHGRIGAKASNPGTLPTGQGNWAEWSPDGAYIAVAHTTSPFVSVYPWSGGAFGTKVSNPATLPADTGSGIGWTSTSDYIAVAHTTDPCVSVYPWSGSFGSKLADPATKPANNGRSVDFSPDDAYMVVSGNVTPFLYAYPFTKTGGGSIGTKLANPGTLPGFSVRDVKFSPQGDYLAAASGDTPFLIVYPWAAGFGTKLTNPGTLPGNEAILAWTEAGSSVLYPGGPAGFNVGYRMKSRLPALEILNGEECGVDPQADYMTSALDTWEQLSLTFTPTSKGIVTVRIHGRAKDSSGIAYFDDFSAS